MASSTMVLPTMASSTMATRKISEMTDKELNELFDKEEAMEAIEQEIIQEEGPEKLKEVAKAINKIDAQKKNLIKSELDNSKNHDRRFFDSEMLTLDKDLLFLMDEPIKFELNKAADKTQFGISFLIIISTLQAFFLYF